MQLSALLLALLLIPPADVCRRNLDTANAMVENFDRCDETINRRALWSYLDAAHNPRPFGLTVEYCLDGALQFNARCEVNEPRVGIWAAPVPVQVGPTKQ